MTNPSQAAREAAADLIAEMPLSADQVAINNAFAQFERECYERAALVADGINLSGFSIGDAQNYIANAIRQLEELR